MKHSLKKNIFSKKNYTTKSTKVAYSIIKYY